MDISKDAQGESAHQLNVLGAGNEDQPASLENDTLGFHPYVEAVFSYLINPATKAPFTLSIEGEWGAGKSSFMCQLQQTLKDNEKRTINFNAWRQDKVESMWAAFALHFIKELTGKLTIRQRLCANICLRLKRFDWGKALLPLLKTLALFVFYIVLAITLFRNMPNTASFFKDDKVNFQAVAAWLGIAGIVLGGLFLFNKVAEVLGNPFKTDLQKFVNAPNYTGNVAFIEEFHRDFKEAVNILTKDNEKIFIFIDDLDRAEVPKAAELMQGLNMMISDSPRLIFIIGMDREKVAAGVAAKYKDLLPFLHPEYGGLNTIPGLEKARGFGYSFLEKFIQLSFQIPRASDSFTRKFIESLSKTESAPSTVAPIRFKSVLEITQGKDAELFREVVFEIAPFFDHNPRRIKQFVNIFRLKAHIAGNTGLFTEKERDIIPEIHTVRTEEREYGALTIPQLGKFIALTMIWPMLLEELAAHPRMLEYSMTGNFPDMPERWKNDEQFSQLLHLRPKYDETSQWDMKYVNVIPLLQTSPPYKAPVVPPFAPPQAADENPNQPNYDGSSNFSSGSTTTTTTSAPPNREFSDSQIDIANNTQQ